MQWVFRRFRLSVDTKVFVQWPCSSSLIYLKFEISDPWRIIQFLSRAVYPYPFRTNIPVSSKNCSFMYLYVDHFLTDPDESLYFCSSCGIQANLEWLLSYLRCKEGERRNSSNMHILNFGQMLIGLSLLNVSSA